MRQRNQLFEELLTPFFRCIHSIILCSCAYFCIPTLTFSFSSSILETYTIRVFLYFCYFHQLLCIFAAGPYTRTRTCSLGLRSQFDSSLITSSPAGVTSTTAANIDAESTTSGNSSASHSSSGPTPPAPPSALMKPSFARSLLPNQLVMQKQQQQQPLPPPATSSSSSSQQQQQQQQQTSSALRPTSLLGDRTLFNKVPFSGFGKV